MADLRHYRLIDGTGIKAIPMEALPPEAWTPLDGSESSDSVSKLVAAVAFLYRCIDVRSAALNAVPWEITRGETTVWKSAEAGEPPTGTQYAWLMDFPALLPRIEEALCIGSQAYLFKERNRSRVLNLRWLTPSSMTVEWGPDGIERYKRLLGSSKPPVYLAPEEVVYIWLQGTHETTPKTAPVHAAMNAAGVLYNADLFAKQFFERGAIKATILAVPAATLRSDKEELEHWFRRAMTGLSKAWASKAINADSVQAIPIGEGLESLSNNNLSTEKREDIATAMGVPHSLVLSNASNFAVSESDRLNLYDTTIVRECERIEEALNAQLFREMGLRFRYLPQELSIYQEDEEQRASAVESYVRAGMPLSVAVRILGVNLPGDVTPESLDEQSEPEPEEVQSPEAAPGIYDAEMTARVAEQERFKRWARRRMGRKAFDPAAFASEVLTDADRDAVLLDLREEDGDADDAPFPDDAQLGWDGYP